MSHDIHMSYSYILYTSMYIILIFYTHDDIYIYIYVMHHSHSVIAVIPHRRLEKVKTKLMKGVIPEGMTTTMGVDGDFWFPTSSVLFDHPTRTVKTTWVIGVRGSVFSGPFGSGDFDYFGSGFSVFPGRVGFCTVLLGVNWSFHQSCSVQSWLSCLTKC